ncbi:annexin-2 receptor [Camelus ferus]|uniref:Annexin-2 receptor n=1 Tax=Camelus ferus TaxID=419612 RepID=S9XV59_CAMFR|nr:annexin-2 receptor [Camelus ferus]EPY75525.1 hypothetical protein CB1_001633012 [Camelus ferus]
MEQNFPQCVREAWDSAEKSQEPEMLQILSLADPEEWQLPFYPKLGHLSWDNQNFNRELLSTPCGLLRAYCPKHGPRAQRTSPPAPDPMTTTRQEPQAPPGEAAAARPQSFSGLVFQHRGPKIWNPRPLTSKTHLEHRPPPGLGRHNSKSQDKWQRTNALSPRTWAASPAAFRPKSPHLR